MDLDAIYNPSEFHKLITLTEMEALRHNTDVNIILIRAFLGGWDSNQVRILQQAIDKLMEKYGPLGFEIIYEKYNNDVVRNQLKWSVTDLFTYLIAADIHLIPTHCHQGNIAKGGTDTWNMPNILENYQRLYYHLGWPNGRKLGCFVWSQNKRKLYEVLESLDLCVPTLYVSIKEREVAADDLEKIVLFIAKINDNPRFSTREKQFAVKLSYTTAGHHNSTMKRAKGGLSGILKRIKEFTNNPRVFGYIEDVVIQPLILRNREASVVCFDGEPQFRNPHKSGHKEHKSPFPQYAKDELFFGFARKVIKEVRAACPDLIADQILRVDFFGERFPDGSLGFLVNEIEGLEARLWGVGVTSGDQLAEIEVMAYRYWYYQVDTLIALHIEAQRNRNTLSSSTV